MVQLNLRAALHHVRKSSQLLRVSAAARAKVRVLARPVLGDCLRSEATSSIICLVFVVLFLSSFQPTGFRERPSGHVLLVRGQGASLWHVPARTDGVRG